MWCGHAKVKAHIQGRREDFFQWGPLGNFSSGGAKVVKFDFYHSKLRKQHFVAKILKIHGGLGPPAPLPTPIYM